MKETEKQALKGLHTPGTVVEVERQTAEELGAFEEDALTEEEARDSADTEDRNG